MIYIVEKNFNVTKINPFTGKGYDSNWIAYFLTDSKDYKIINGKSADGLYTIKVSKNYLQWKISLMDFIEFQIQNDKNIILALSKNDFKEAKNAYRNHKFNEKILREYELEVMVHSTTKSFWKSIQKDKMLKSWNILKKEKTNWEKKPIGEKLGDPKEFSDYIMFSNGNISSEIVTLSKQNNKLIMDENKSYETGVRLYFNMRKIAEDGLLIRDGCHAKVKDSLPLEKYLIWVADWKNTGLLSKYSTPKEFTNKANATFNKIYDKYIFEEI
ncbi:MAG: hypothetical protein ACRDAU_15230 [Clostridium sp.]